GEQIFIEKFTVNVTEMFRDPHFYKTLEEKIFPVLKQKDHIRIWSAGCSSGEEILSLSILLYELNLLHKCSILGTDINPKMLDIARSLTYKIRHIKTYFKPYLYAGGQHGLEKYFTTHGEHAIFNSFLHNNVRFKTFNLLDHLTEENPFDLVVCRNVLIYFKSTLQNKVIDNLCSNLKPGGFLGLGSKESIIFYENKSDFKEIDLESKLYQKL
ncbi:MAG: CheR family methyltransferase, partial [Owenweeksia sp.]